MSAALVKLSVAFLAVACLLTPGMRGVHAQAISVEDDLFLGVWMPGVSRWETRVPVCVWSNDGTSLYRVTASGINSGDRFQLTNNIGDAVRYRVFWHSGNNFRRQERLRPNVPSRRAYSFEQNAQCAAGPTAEIRVRLNKRAIDRAVPGIYDDTLMLMLSPL